MPSPQRTGHANGLLAKLPRKDLGHFLAGCEQVELSLGEVLYTPGERIRHVYFPTDSFISLLTTVDDNSCLEIALIGREGMFGAPLILGVKMASLYSLVQGAGSALRMDAATFILELEHSPALRKRMLAYTYILMNQFARMAACTHFHLVEKRLPRWLLMTQDRTRSNQFHITHEFLAYMLGVRREGVTEVATALKKRELISYSRGDITIHDRNGLIAASCGCYSAQNEMYDRVMG